MPRYKILCTKKLAQPTAPEKAARVILEHLAISEDQYRFGNSKVQLYSYLYLYKQT